MAQYQIIIAFLWFLIVAQFASFVVLVNLIIGNNRANQAPKHQAPGEWPQAPEPPEEVPEPSLTVPVCPEKQPRPREEVAKDLDEYWASKPADVRKPAPVKPKAEPPSLPDAPSQYRTAKRGKESTEAAPTFRKWQVGDKAIVKREVAAPAFEEDECLRVGAMVQVHSIKKLSAVVFDPTNPLRGIAEADRGIGGWVIAFRNLELIKD